MGAPFPFKELFFNTLCLFFPDKIQSLSIQSQTHIQETSYKEFYSLYFPSDSEEHSSTKSAVNLVKVITCPLYFSNILCLLWDLSLQNPQDKLSLLLYQPHLMPRISPLITIPLLVFFISLVTPTCNELTPTLGFDSNTVKFPLHRTPCASP